MFGNPQISYKCQTCWDFLVKFDFHLPSKAWFLSSVKMWPNLPTQPPYPTAPAASTSRHFPNASLERVTSLSCLEEMLSIRACRRKKPKPPISLSLSMENPNLLHKRWSMVNHTSLPGPLGRAASNPAKSGSALPWKHRHEGEVVGLGFQSWKKHANVTLPVLFKTVLLRMLPIEQMFHTWNNGSNCQPGDIRYPRRIAQIQLHC